ncbi:hypothetical protein ABID22_002785 [Pontibacter aydingkolensis]|uniref:Uncharacterized protein n=1 Tax=Pontibacter aydingkolensis TaxID=1911536 RepID=A0ABS7CXE5_9BACT|nr:hypothetical protein [Pontibacter aydingkolensis]MBW7468376.1 hypothetical protein [Pontibacter aydingkolensis]
MKVAATLPEFKKSRTYVFEGAIEGQAASKPFPETEEMDQLWLHRLLSRQGSGVPNKGFHEKESSMKTLCWTMEPIPLLQELMTGY